MATKDETVDTQGYSSDVQKSLLLGKDGINPASNSNPVPTDATVSVDTMTINAEMSEATGHDYYPTTTNLGDGTLTIGFDSVSGLTLADIIKVENKTQGWIYITKGATVTDTSIALVAANQQTGYPATGATDEFEVIYRGVSRFDAIKTSVELIDDTVKVAGTDTYMEGSTKTIVMGAVRNDAGTSLVDTDQEITPLQVNAYGLLNTNLDMIRDVPPDVGAGNVSAGSQRVTLATDDVNAAAIKAATEASQTALEIMDDWDESDRAKVNPIVGQAGIAAGAGAVGATVPRTTLASDDPAVTSLGVIDNMIGTVDSAAPTQRAVIASVAESTVPTEVSDADVVNPWHDTFGRQVMYGANLSAGAQDVREVSPALTQTIEQTLLSAVTATGASASVDVSGYNKLSFMYIATGVTTGATITIDWSPDNSNWVTLDTEVISATGNTDFKISDTKLKYIRANVTAYTDGTHSVKMIGGN